MPAAARKGRTNIQVHVQRNTDGFERSKTYATKAPIVMKQYVDYMERESFIRRAELEDDVDVVIPHVPLPRKAAGAASDDDIRYGYSLQEIKDNDMSLGDLFGHEHATGFLVLSYKNPQKFRQANKEYRILQADKARHQLLQESSTEEDTPQQNKRNGKKRHGKKKQGWKQNGNAVNRPEPALPLSMDISQIPGLSNILDTLSEKIHALEAAVSDEQQKAAEERRNAEEERRRADEERKNAEEHRRAAAKAQLDFDRQMQALQDEVDFLRANNLDTSEWLSETGTDGQALRRIRLRNLLDLAQAKLAYYAGLSGRVHSPDGSRNWRVALQSIDLIEDRMVHAKSLISDSNYPHVAVIFESPEALRLAVEHPSRIRLDGDEAAHLRLPRSIYEAAVNEHRHAKIPGADGLSAFVDFLFPP